MNRASFTWEVYRGDTFYKEITLYNTSGSTTSLLDLTGITIKATAYENADRTGKTFELPITKLTPETSGKICLVMTPTETLAIDDGNVSGNFTYQADIQLTKNSVTVCGKSFNDVKTLARGTITVVDDLTI